MTIVVGVGTSEGLVLAGDSRTTTAYSDTQRHRIASDYAQKLFQVKGMGVATFGWAFLERDTIAGVMDQFTAQVSGEVADMNVEEFATALGDFFDERFDQHLAAEGGSWDSDTQGFPLGFLVAGYDPDGVGYIVEVLIPGGQISEYKASTTEGGMMWRGQTDVINRLIKGIDGAELLKLGIEVPDDLAKELGKLEYWTMSPITLQDGIDFTSFLVCTTIDMQRFSDGTHGSPGSIPGCGGPVQILAVERRGATWIRPLTLATPSRPGLAEGAAP